MCGSSKVLTRYIEGYEGQKDYLAHRCQNCNYLWKTQTLEQEMLSEAMSKFDECNVQPHSKDKP